MSVGSVNNDKSSPRLSLFCVATDSGFYQRGGKRMFDASASAMALLLLLPLFSIVALLIKLTSRGPIIYFQQRVGGGGRLFRIAKFRSMQDNAERAGSAITWRGDARITAVGRVLRFLKIDELPQLWNVLRGEMSLVGPRPEVPRYVRHYNARQRKVLTVRPGITDLASIKYRNEERLLSQSLDPERFYQDVILPHKLDLNLKYLEKMSFSYDLLLLIGTAAALPPLHLKSIVPNA
jgi:lipopolysaccharide/colanic/teichoic acid biosynthesis glycosyltransferase